jgi:hypothetical protein
MGKILDVNPDFESLDEESEFFKHADADSLRCLGPNTSAGCPVLDGRACPKANDATVILCQLDLDNEGHRHILAAYRETDADVIAVVSPEDNIRWNADLSDVTIIVGPPTRSDLEDIARRASKTDRDLDPDHRAG